MREKVNYSDCEIFLGKLVIHFFVHYSFQNWSIILKFWHNRKITCVAFWDWTFCSVRSTWIEICIEVWKYEFSLISLWPNLIYRKIGCENGKLQIQRYSSLLDFITLWIHDFVDGCLVEIIKLKSVMFMMRPHNMYVNEAKKRIIFDQSTYDFRHSFTRSHRDFHTILK